MSKSVEDRVREGVALLKKIQEVGIDISDDGYIQLKAKISDWVKTGDPWTGKIKFSLDNRVAEVLLPRKATAVASLALKATGN